MRENILKKISSLCVTIFIVTGFKSQDIKISIKNENLQYSFKENYSPIDLSYKIENNTDKTIYFVLNKKAFGFFVEPNQYDFNFGISNNPNLQEEEKIFNARLLVLKKETDTLSLDFDHGGHSHYDLSSQAALKEIFENEQLEESLKKDSLRVFEKYKQDNHLQKKSINWIARAKYINDNIIIMKPHEIIQITTPIDFYSYYYNSISKSGVGYDLKEDSYTILVKIHNDSDLIGQYLSTKIINRLKKVNAVPLKHNYFSNKINLKVRHR